MRWRVLLCSCHPFTAGYKNKPHCMYGLQVHTEFTKESWTKWSSVQWPSSSEDTPIYQMAALNKWETWWSHAKTSLWKDAHSPSGYFDHSVVAVWESWWHHRVEGEGMCWQSRNLFSRQIMSNGAGAVSRWWWSFASRVSHSCWYRQCSVCRRQQIDKYCQKSQREVPIRPISSMFLSFPLIYSNVEDYGSL